VNSEKLDAQRGSEALMAVRRRKIDGPSDEFFKNVVETTTGNSNDRSSNLRFWMGTAFGGAIAASLFAIAFLFGWTDSGQESEKSTAEFVVAVGEPRQMNLAFETDRALDGATISILLSGDVEIDGYGIQRELTWSQDLDAGVNRLVLPILASGINGGQMIVRMTHPLSEQVFVINLPAES
jgi:hypothetical protein